MAPPNQEGRFGVFHFADGTTFRGWIIERPKYKDGEPWYCQDLQGNDVFIDEYEFAEFYDEVTMS